MTQQNGIESDYNSKKEWAGRWRIQNASDTYDRFQIEADGWGIILRCEDVSEDPQAHAHLIAAAPELLEALLAFKYAFENSDVQAEFVGQMLLGDAIIKAEAAIAKAEGG